MSRLLLFFAYAKAYMLMARYARAILCWRDAAPYARRALRCH